MFGSAVALLQQSHCEAVFGSFTVKRLGVALLQQSHCEAVFGSAVALLQQSHCEAVRVRQPAYSQRQQLVNTPKGVLPWLGYSRATVKGDEHRHTPSRATVKGDEHRHTPSRATVSPQQGITRPQQSHCEPSAGNHSATAEPLCMARLLLSRGLELHRKRRHTRMGSDWNTPYRPGLRPPSSVLPSMYRRRRYAKLLKTQPLRSGKTTGNQLSFQRRLTRRRYARLPAAFPTAANPWCDTTSGS